MQLTLQTIRQKRDKKVRDAMEAYAPVWLANEEYIEREDSLLFNLIYQNSGDGWVNHRFKYDGFSDVLYYMGVKYLKEEEVLPILDEEPYLAGEISTRVPNAPAHRLSPPPPSPRTA
jgi:hypothetical protein